MSAPRGARRGTFLERARRVVVTATLVALLGGCVSPPDMPLERRVEELLVELTFAAAEGGWPAIPPVEFVLDARRDRPLIADVVSAVAAAATTAAPTAGAGRSPLADLPAIIAERLNVVVAWAAPPTAVIAILDVDVPALALRRALRGAGFERRDDGRWVRDGVVVERRDDVDALLVAQGMPPGAALAAAPLGGMTVDEACLLVARIAVEPGATAWSRVAGDVVVGAGPASGLSALPIAEVEVRLGGPPGRELEAVLVMHGEREAQLATVVARLALPQLLSGVGVDSAAVSIVRQGPRIVVGGGAWTPDLTRWFAEAAAAPFAPRVAPEGDGAP